MKRLIWFGLLVSAFAQGPPYPYSTNLGWTLSTSNNVAGQNVYRGPFSNNCTGATKLTTTPLPATSVIYVDQNPAEGNYCYFVTAVNKSNVESGPSNITQVAIGPPPPTGLNATVATNTNGSKDVIYAWKNPKPAQRNTIYSDNKQIIAMMFPTTKVRITSPSGSHTVFVTDSDANGESGPSNKVKVVVP